ncbi:MAG: hypothetical protein HKUEN02_00920 [Anaerolineaceae bacterium]|nr:MAG: hypothetical protein HKUEN02_00920 [Anaerolineaceae bacterium]
MLSKFNWLTQLTRKETIFLALLVVSGGWVGCLCGRVATQYRELFVPFSQALKSAAWVIASLILIEVLIGISSALLRPLRLLLFGHSLGAIAFLFTWRDGWIPFAGMLVYFAGMALYSRILSLELERRLTFSLRPLIYEQRKIVVLLSLLLSISFAWGYRFSAQDQLVVPQGYKRAAEEMLLSNLKSQVQNQPDLDPIEKDIYLEQARRTLDDSWNRLESSLQSYARFIPIGLILPLYLLLVGLLDSLAWIAYFLLWLILSALKRFGVAQTFAETSEREILRL